MAVWGREEKDVSRPVRDPSCLFFTPGQKMALGSVNIGLSLLLLIYLYSPLLKALNII